MFERISKAEMVDDSLIVGSFHDCRNDMSSAITPMIDVDVVDLPKRVRLFALNVLNLSDHTDNYHNLPSPD
jgi:hypothetical protein